MDIYSNPLFITIIISVAVFVFYVIGVRSDILRKKMKELGGRVNWMRDLLFTVDGQTVTLKYYPGSRKSSPWLEISAGGVFGADLLIRRENSSDRFYKGIGLNREAQVADKQIDEGLFFECDIPEFVRKLFLNQEAKPLVLEILSNFSTIQITSARCTFRRSPCEPLEQIDNALILEAARKLLSFITLIPGAIVSDQTQAQSFKTWKTTMYFIGYGAFILGVAAFIWAQICFRLVDGDRVWFVCLPAELLIFCACAYFAFQKIKGFSTSSRVLTHFLCSLGIGILLLGRYGVAVANGILDRSAPQKFQQLLVTKYITTHKSSKTYHAALAPWRLGNPRFEFTVGQSEYMRIQPGKTYYSIVTKSGRFGFEWVILVRLARVS